MFPLQACAEGSSGPQALKTARPEGFTRHGNCISGDAVTVLPPASVVLRKKMIQTQRKTYREVNTAFLTTILILVPCSLASCTSLAFQGTVPGVQLMSEQTQLFLPIVGKVKASSLHGSLGMKLAKQLLFAAASFSLINPLSSKIPWEENLALSACIQIICFMRNLT